MGYYVDVRHGGFNKFRRITGNDKYVVEQKAASQMALWDEAWSKKQKIEKKKLNAWNKQEEATEKTAKAQEILKSLEGILLHTLGVNDQVDWEKLKLPASFSKTEPEPKLHLHIPKEPKRRDAKYNTNNIFLDILSLLNLSEARKKKDAKFKEDFSDWEKEKAKIEENNRAIDEQNDKDLRAWEAERDEYPRKREEVAKAIDNQRKKYLDKDDDAIADYCDIVLTNSEYPDFIPREYDLQFNPDNGILIVEYRLPDVSDIPRLKEVKYNKSQDVFKEYFLSDSAFNKFYDGIIYRICLRTIHELLEADVVDALKSVVFNGWVKSIDKATGREVNTCIMSIQVLKEEFMQINLEHVEPKTCFKSLKGIGSSKLHGLVAIQPILNLNKEDKRFVEAQETIDRLASGQNIAAMPWEEFEHLIREIFEKEFNQSGGEVKVTRASRDGGVDAVAFDPDPIRGGKIIIQAKRYTNTVGVAAVRDLYGTVINEGAIKGILISTADYGPDAYDFAKTKPITLLSGSHLLHMLEKHGHNVRIDLIEAKKVLKEQEVN